MRSSSCSCPANGTTEPSGRRAAFIGALPFHGSAIRTHNTDLKKRLAAYAGQYPDQCRRTDADPDTGCMEFEIAKFRLTAPYSEERRKAVSEAAKKCGVHRKVTHLYGDRN